MSRLELITLGQLATSVPDSGRIVEIGSYMGKSTCQLARHALPTVGIDAIDLFPEETVFMPPSHWRGYPENNRVYRQRDLFIQNTSAYPNIRMIVASSSRELGYSLEPQIDLLFLDAEHSNPSDRDYLEYFMPRMRVGGILSGHDFDPNFPDVIANVNWLEQYYGTRATIIESLWWLQVTR